MHDNLNYMGGRTRKGSSPKDLVPANLSSQITFRLSPSDADALRALAKSVGLGQSTLCRRIVEEYLREHAGRYR